MSVSPPSSLGSVPPPRLNRETRRWPVPPRLETYAGFWIRALAWLVDSFVVGFAYGVPVSILFPQQASSTCTHLVSAGMCVAPPPNYYLAATTLPNLVMTGLYFVLTWWLLGGTLGQRLLGLRVVDEATGGRISLLQSIGRFFGYLLSVWLLCLGIIWVATDTYKQGWHDKLAHTFVVRQYR